MVVSTYQAASGAGYQAMLELENQSREILEGKKPTMKVFPYQIAFQLFSHNSALGPNGYNVEETKMVLETQKDFRLPGYCDYRYLHSCAGFQGTLREYQSGVHRADYGRPGQGPFEHRAGR